MARLTGLSPSTVTIIVRELLAAGLVEESHPTPTGNVGRDPIAVRLRAEARSAIGIQLSDTRIIGVLLDLRGTVLRRAERRFDAGPSDPPPLPDLIAQIVSIVNELQKPELPLLGVGVAVAGMVQSPDGVVFAPNLHDAGFDLGRQLRSFIDVPVFVENEVNAMLLAELTYGVARRWRNILGINIGLGIGGSIVMDGDLKPGSSGAAGEIGHMIVEPAGPLCTCGRRGCLESLAGGKALKSVQGSGEVDRLLLQKATSYLAIGIANAVNMLNPEMIVVGGTHSHLFAVTGPAFRELLGQYLLPVNQGVAIARVSVGDPEAVGAAAVVLNDFFHA